MTKNGCAQKLKDVSFLFLLKRDSPGACAQPGRVPRPQLRLPGGRRPPDLRVVGQGLQERPEVQSQAHVRENQQEREERQCSHSDFRSGRRDPGVLEGPDGP